MTQIFGRAGLFRQHQHRRRLERSPEFTASGGMLQAAGQGVGCLCSGNHGALAWPWENVPGPLIFTYQAGYEHLGNVLLRAHQVADLLEDHGPPFPVYSQSLENLYVARPRGATIVVSKTGVKVRHLGVLTALKKAGNTLLFDMVDGVVPPELEDLPDAYVCSSVTEWEARQAAGHRAFTSLHSPDHRILHRGFAGKSFGLVYFGLPENARHIDDIPDIIALSYEDMPPHRSTSPTPAAFTDMANASHHYSIRQWGARDGFKPLTKAAVAGAFGACIIAAADEYEAVTLLGRDYPYLAASSAKDDVIQAIEFAKATYLTDTWRSAVAHMTALNERTCPVATAHQLVAGIAALAR